MRPLDAAAGFAAGTLVGGALWLYGHATRIAANACDQPSCASATELHNSGYLIAVGAALFAVALAALIVWAARAHERQQRDRPKGQKPSLRDL
jgi:ribose 5-phosphate isomerase RpiB